MLLEETNSGGGSTPQPMMLSAYLHIAFAQDDSDLRERGLDPLFVELIVGTTTPCIHKFSGSGRTGQAPEFTGYGEYAQLSQEDLAAKWPELLEKCSHSVQTWGGDYGEPQRKMFDRSQKWFKS
jgi:hypothetical protein